MSDEHLRDLIRSAKAGDSDAKDELLALFADQTVFGEMLLRFIRRRLPSGHPARRIVNSQDILNSALATVILNFERFDGEAVGQLFKFIHFAILDKIRKRRPERVTALVDEDSLALEANDFEDALRETEALKFLFEAVAKLPPSEKVATWLLLDGESNESIAALLDIRQDAVRKRHQRAVEKLQREFRRRGLVPPGDDSATDSPGAATA